MPLFRGPIERRGSTPGADQDRFPGFDVLDEVERWDAATAGVVLARLTSPPALRFFTVDEEAIGRALFDRLLDQRDDPRVPVLEMVDARLAEGQTDGWRYADLAEDGDAFRKTFAAIDDDAHEAFNAGYAELGWDDRGGLLGKVQDASDGSWRGMPAGHVWSLWTRYACTAFYSHPWAWNEIGFGGPAYPRGYKNIGIDALEPWEVRDHTNQAPQ